VFTSLHHSISHPNIQQSQQSPTPPTQTLIIIKTRHTIHPVTQNRWIRFAAQLGREYDLVLLRDITVSEKPNGIYTDMTPIVSYNVSLSMVLDRFPFLREYLYTMKFGDNKTIGSNCCGRAEMWQLFRPSLYPMLTNISSSAYKGVWILEDDCDIIRSNRSVLMEMINTIDRQDQPQSDLIGFRFKKSCCWGMIRRTPQFEKYFVALKQKGVQHEVYSDSAQRWSWRLVQEFERAFDRGEYLWQEYMFHPFAVGYNLTWHDLNGEWCDKLHFQPLFKQSEDEVMNASTLHNGTMCSHLHY